MKLFYSFTFFFLLITGSCSKEENHKDCSLVPEVGNCKGAFTRYYFDQKEQKCKIFYWGGCDGAVPFETLADCNKKCPCQRD